MRTTLLLCSLLPLSLTWGVDWVQTGDGNWSAGGNWSSTAPPNSVDAVANFGTVANNTHQVTVDSNFTVGSLTFNSTNAAEVYTIGGSSSLTLSVSSGTASISMGGSVDAAQTITAPLTLTSNLTVDNGAGSSNLNLNGSISEATSGRSMTLQGLGSIYLSGTNNFTGGLTIDTNVFCVGPNTLPSAGTTYITTNGNLLLQNNSQNIGGLTGDNNGLLNLGSAISPTVILTITTSGATTYAGAINGKGSLVVTGTGSLTLSGTSSFTSGITTVSGGTLILGLNDALPTGLGITVTSPGVFNLANFDQKVANISGNGSITLGSGTLTIGGGPSATFSGVISGSGSVVINSTSTLTLSGSNTYTGGTEIQAGTLQVGANNTLPTNGDVTMSGGTLDINSLSQTVGTLSTSAGTITLGTGQLTVAPTADASLLAVISGAGTVIYQGPNTWTIGAAQTFTGGFTINGGTVQMGLANGLSNALPVTVNSPGVFFLNGYDTHIQSLAGGGTVSLGNNKLTLHTSGTTSFSGVISGTGNLLVSGTGTQILVGANTYSGSTTVDAGATLEGTTVGVRGQIFNNGVLFFNQSFDGAYAGPLLGFGQLKVGGGGTLTLTGGCVQNSVLIQSGELDVASGVFLVAPNVTVNSSGTFGGSGELVGSISNSGTINPTNQLTVSADVTFQNGSFFVADLTPGGADLLSVGGTVTINNGSEVLVNVLPGQYGVVTRYPIIEAGNPVVGQFQGFEIDNPFLNIDFIYNQLLPGSVEVALSIKPIGEVIQGGNAGAIAQCLTPANMLLDRDLEHMVSQLIFLPVDRVRDVLNEMQPSQLRELTVAEQNNTLFAQEMISWRQAAFDRTACEEAISKCHPWNFWVSLAGNWTDQRPFEHNIGYEAPAVGLSTGFDGKIADNLFLGLAAEYGHVALSWKESRGSATINRASFGPYLSWVGRFGYVNGSILASIASFDATRKIPFFQREATSSHTGETLLAHLDAGLVFHPAPGVSFTPFAMADLMYGWEDGFQESGAQSLNFSIASSSSTFLRSELGLKISKCAVRSHGKWVHDLKASWVREARFGGQSLKATFEEFPCSFTVQGLYPSRNLLDLGMGLTFIFKQDRLSASLRYDGQFGEGVSIQSGIVQLLTRF